MSLTQRDRIFVAAAKKLRLLDEAQVAACAEVAFARRKLGVEKELGDVALDKGFLEPEGLKRIMTLAAKAEVRSRPATGSEEVLLPVVEEPVLDEVASGAHPALPEDDAIEGYQLGERLGEGGMAAVFRARHRALDREVALKILFAEYSQNPEYVARFVREARAAARIEHPNVVRTIDAGESKGRHYIVMELVLGLNLEAAVKRDGTLSELAALEVGLGVAKALEAAHQEKLVHRDVKPANIVRTPDGRVKLLDLGLARAAHRTGADGFITDHGRTLGTPYYVSPEQARGEEIDIRSDIYSLGITLYFLVTGEHPYTAATAPEVMRMHIVEPVPSARKRRPDLSAEFDELLGGMLAKDRKKRPETPAELVRLIERVRQGDGGGRDRDARRRPERAKERPARAAPASKADGPKIGAGAGASAASGVGAGAGAGAGAARGTGAGAGAARGAEAWKTPPRTAVSKLVLAAGALSLLLTALLAARASLGSPVSESEVARAETERARRAALARAAAGAPVSTASDALPADFAEIKKRVDEQIQGGDPQGALMTLKRLIPIERRTGATKAAMQSIEAEVQRSIKDRFEKDLANVEEQRRQGRWKIADKILERVALYGGAAEKARAEQERAKLDAEARAAAAARAAGPSAIGDADRAALRTLLDEVAALVRRGEDASAAERLKARAVELPEALGELVLEGAKLVLELSLLDAMAADAIRQLAGEELAFRLASGEAREGTVVEVDKQGKVTLEPKGGKGERTFLVSALAPPEKERFALLARGRPDVERLLVISELYRGERRAALERATSLGSPSLLSHARRIVEWAGADAEAVASVPPAGAVKPAAEGTPSSAAEPAADPAAPAKEPPAPRKDPAPAKPEPPKEPAGPKEPAAPRVVTPLDRVLEAFLKAPFTSERGQRLTISYDWQPGAEATVDDWRFEKQPFRRGMTQKGLQLDCPQKQTARLLHKVPMDADFRLELVFQVEQKSAASRVSVIFAEGKGGSSYAVECGEGVVKRQRGEIVQELRKPAQPVADVLRIGGEMTVVVTVKGEDLSVERAGKKVCERVRVPNAGGAIGFEVTDAKVDLRSVKLSGSPDTLWVADELKRLKPEKSAEK